MLSRVVLLLAPAAGAEPVRVIDGVPLKMASGEVIRLWEIVAPEAPTLLGNTALM